MLIALARFAERFGLSAVGVQYQQGLARSCAASDFAEGAIGSAERFPIPAATATIIRPGKPMPCINEVDMGSAIPQTMLWRLLDSLGLPSETTLHDIRWGSEFEGTFYWDLEISGAVPFAHLKGGIAGAVGFRQPPMYFPKGGATITGQCKAGRFVWARANYVGTSVFMHIGTGHAVELPHAEFERRRRATTYEWPLMNCRAGRDWPRRPDGRPPEQPHHRRLRRRGAAARRDPGVRGPGIDAEHQCFGRRRTEPVARGLNDVLYWPVLMSALSRDAPASSSLGSARAGSVHYRDSRCLCRADPRLRAEDDGRGAQDDGGEAGLSPSSRARIRLPVRRPCTKGRRMTDTIRGFWVAMATPIASDGRVDQAALTRHAHWLFEQDCDGIVLFGTTGEGPSFSAQERLNSVAAMIGDGIGPDRIALGAGFPSIVDSIALSRDALSLGLRHLLLLPPYFYRDATPGDLRTHSPRSSTA